MASSWSSNKGDFKKEPKQIFSSSGMYQSNPGRSGQGSSGGTSESPPSASETADFNNDFYKKPENEAETSLRRRKTEITNDSIDRLQNLTQIMKSTLASLNLPAALEDLSRSKVHQSVVEKAQQIRDIGGIDFLTTEMEELSVLFQRNKKVLEECFKMIHDEEKADKNYWEQFKERWTRTPSAELNRSIKDENMKYKDVLETAVDAYKIAQEKYEEHKQAIELLSKSTEEIDKVLFSMGGTQVSKDSEVVKELRKLMKEAESIKAEREGLEKLFKETLTPTADNDKMTKLDIIYGPLQQQVTDSQKKQESVISQIKKASEALEASDQSETKQWESKLKDLAAGYDRSMEIKSYIEDCRKCYSELTPFLDCQQKKVSDFCFKRGKEKEELLNELQKSDASYLPKNQGASNQSQQSPPQSSEDRPPDIWPNSPSKAPSTQSGPPSYSTAPPGPPAGAVGEVTKSLNEMEEAGRQNCEDQQKKSAQGPGRMTSSLLTKGARSKTGMDYSIKTSWKSERLTMEKRQPVNFYDYCKWCFQLKNMEQRKKIDYGLKELNSRIVHEIKETEIDINFQYNATFKGDGDFHNWRCECGRIVDEIISDVLIVTIGCQIEATKDIYEILSRKFSRALRIVEQKDSHGVCFVACGESLVTIIEDIQKRESFQNTCIWETETNQEIGVQSIKLDDNQTRCWNLFHMEEKVKEKFPTVKIYVDSEGKSLKLVGNKDDVKQELDFITNKPLLYSHHRETKVFDREVIEFLSQEVVKKFLDGEIKKTGMGTWILSTEKNSVDAYSVDDKKVKIVMETICKSFCDLAYQIAVIREQEEKIHRFQKRATELENETNGKFSMKIKNNKAGIRVHVLFTSDLGSSSDILGLLDDIKQEAERRAPVKLKCSPEVFQFIKTMERDYILGLSQDVDVEFADGNILLLKGDKASISVVKKYTDDMKLRQSSMFLPQSLTMHPSPEKLCEEHHCLLKKMQSNPESKVWFMNNRIVIVYQGEPREDLSVSWKAVLRISDEKNKLAFSTVMVSQKTVDIPILTKLEDKAKHSAHESFKEAYRKMLDSKIESILIPLKTGGNLTTKKLVKALLYPLMQLEAKEVITIILHSDDPSQCKTANEVIQDANAKGIKFVVEKSNITEAKVDVIVNTVDASLNLKKGYVSNAILQAATNSQKLQEELIRKKSDGENAEYGRLFETDSHGLRCRKIFHGALKAWTKENDTSEKIMQKFILSCLEKADEYKFSELAFPALGTGKLGFPRKKVAEIIKETVRRFEKDHPETSIKKIVFVIYSKDEETFKVFQDFFREFGKDVDIAESGLEEIVVCGHEKDVRNVVQKLKLQLQVKCLQTKSNMTEPKSQTIIHRNGKESTDGVAGSTSGAEQKHDTSQKIIPNKGTKEELDDTKYCKIVRFTEKKVLEENFRLWKLNPRAIICPYEKDKALVVFKSWEDAEKFSKHPGQFEVQDLEQQAVRNIEAQISKEYLSRITDLDGLEKSLIECSGVWVERIDQKSWILHGNLPQIELAHKHLSYEIQGHKENIPEKTDVTQQNPKSSTFNSNQNLTGECKKSIPMTEERFQKLSPFLQPMDEESDGNFYYRNQNLHVTGSKSFVEWVENQTKKVITKLVDIAEDVYGLMKGDADVMNLQKLSSPIICKREDGKLEVSGMSQADVDSAVKMFEDKRDKIEMLRRQKSKSHANCHTFFTKEGLEVEIYGGSMRELNLKCLIQFTTETCLQTSLGKSKKITEGSCIPWKTSANLPYELIIYACVPVIPFKFDDQTSEFVKGLIFKAIKLANEKKATSLGIPLWTAKEYRDTKICSEMYAAAILDFSSVKGVQKYIKKIHIMETDDATVDCIAKTFDESFKKSFENSANTAGVSTSFKPSKTNRSPTTTEYNLSENFKLLISLANPLMVGVDVVCCAEDRSFQSNGYIARCLSQNEPVQEELSREAKRNRNVGHILSVKCNVYDAKQLLFLVTKLRASDYESKGNIKLCLSKVLEFVDKNEVKQLVLPLLGSGKKGLSKKDIASLYLESVTNYLESKKSTRTLREIHFVHHDEEYLKIFNDCFANLFHDNFCTGTRV